MRCSVEFEGVELALVVLAVSVRVDVSGWECYSEYSVANLGYETEQAIDMGENSG